MKTNKATSLAFRRRNASPAEDVKGKSAPALQQKRRGRIARTMIGTAKVLGRPYLEAGKSMVRLQGVVRRLGRSIAGGADVASEDVQYINAPDAAAAFEKIYAARGWSESELQEQRKAVVRRKFLALFCGITFFGVGLFGMFTVRHLGYISIGASVIGVTTATLGIGLFVQYAIYQAQIDERRLISFKEFFAGKDRWTCLFSS